MLQFAHISLLLSFCLLIGIACSSNESTNQRTGGSSTSAENESDDDEDLFGGLVFPPEDSLVSYLTAEVKNSRVRCEYKDNNLDNTFLSCVVVVVQYDGRELLPLKKSPGLKIDWKNLQNSVGNFIGDCTPSLDKLSATCKIDKFDDQTLSNDRLVIAGANFSDGNEAALRQDTVKLKLKIGVVAGLVPNVPVKYVSQDVLQSSTSLNLADNSESVGFQPLSSGLKDQVVLNDRGLGFIGSACIREKKIYFSSGLNIFWIKDWTAKDAEIQLYSGASSVDRVFANSSEVDHRLWVSYRGDQTIYCAPNGLVAVDHGNGRIWRLWDDSKAKHIAGKGAGDKDAGLLCREDKVVRANGVPYSKSDGVMNALEAKLSCIQGLDILPTNDHIYFAHSETRDGNTNVYKLNHAKNELSWVMKVDDIQDGDAPIYDKKIFKESQNSFRIKNKSRSPAFRFRENGKFLMSDYGSIVEGDVFTGEHKILSLATGVSYSYKSSYGAVVRGFYEKGNDFFVGTEKAIIKFGSASGGTYISKDYTGETPSVLLADITSRSLDSVADIKDVKLVAVQSIEINRHKDYDNILIAEWDAIRILENGKITTVFKKADLEDYESRTKTEGCLSSVPGDKALLPFVSDLFVDSNSNLYLATSGVASPKTEGGANIYSTFYDMMKLDRSAEKVNLISYKDCISGEFYVDNSQITFARENNISSNDPNGLAIRQDWYPTIYETNEGGNTTKHLAMFSGQYFYKKIDMHSESPVIRQTVTAIEAHSSRLENGILDLQNSVPTQEQLFGEPENYYLESPIIGSTFLNNKLYVLTGLVTLSTKLWLTIMGDDDVLTETLIKGGNVSDIAGDIPTGYKILEIDPATNQSKVIFHSFPSKSVLTGFDSTSSLRNEDVWKSPWQLGRGGIDGYVENNLIKFYVTTPFMLRVEEVAVSVDYTFDFAAPPNETSKIIAGRQFESGDKVIKNFPNNKPATESFLWNPWDISVSNNGDVFVAEALGGGLKRLRKNNDNTWNIFTVLGGESLSSNSCTSGEIEKELSSSADLDQQISQSASMLCKGDVWAIESTDNCSDTTVGAEQRNMRIYLSQNFMTASNIVELIRPCD